MSISREQPGGFGGRRVGIASDHAGIDVKADLASFLVGQGWEVIDLGPFSRESVDYPAFAHKLGRAVAGGELDWGVLICGSGVGMSIAANKIRGVRAALLSDPLTARLSREHNDANVAVVGARILGPELLRDCVRVFGATAFTPGDDGRHARRIARIEPD